MRTRQLLSVLLVLPACLALPAFPALGQVLSNGPDDPSLFDTVFNLPADAGSLPPSIGNSNGDASPLTQLNVGPSGSVGPSFNAFAGAEVNVTDGSVGNGFNANPGSELNISGGSVGNLEASGSLVNISGGTFGNFIAVGSGTTLNVNAGGNIGALTDLFLSSDATVNVNQGGVVSLDNNTYGNNLASNPGSTITLLPGAALADGYNADGVVNFEGGSIGGTFNANAGSQINFRSVTSGGNLVSNAGSEINVLSGGSWTGSSLSDVRGAVNVTAGGSINAPGDIGPGGVVSVSGASAEGVRSTWTNSSDLDIDGASNSRGTLDILAGGRVTVTGVGTRFNHANVLVSGVDANGNPSTLSIGGGLSHARRGDAMMRIDSGGSVTVGGGVGTSGAEGNRAFNALITVDGSDAAGNASALRVTAALSVAGSSGTTATVNVTNGGLITSGGANIGTFGSSEQQADNVGVVNVNGADSFGTPSTWNINGDLRLGQDFVNGENSPVGTLNIGGGTVRVTGTIDLQTGGAIFLNSGRFEFGTQTLDTYNKFIATGGALAGAIAVTGTNGVADLVDVANQIPAANVDTTEVVLLNNGLVFGAGTLDAAFANSASGEIEVITGERMRFNGGNTANAGQVTLLGGQVQFTQAFTNQAGGLVQGNGSLRADGGASNAGTMAFSATANVVGDLVNEATGLITSSGGTTTFFDDVTNSGEVRTDANSFTVYFGEYSGNGDTGTGTVIMEGDLKPGFSPGVTAFGGDLQFGDNASLLIELAGLAPGSEHDQVTVVEDLALNGELDVSLLDGFTLGFNQLYDIVTVGGELTGRFEGLGEGDLVGNFGGADLFITYTAGDGNDVALFTAVPEPSSLALLGLGGLLVARRPRVRPRNTLSRASRETTLMRPRRLLSVLLFLLACVALPAAPAVGQVLNPGPDDSSLFDTVFDLPADAASLPIFIGNPSGATTPLTQLNVGPNGVVGTGFAAFAGAEVNVTGGSVGEGLSLFAGSEANISGGTLGSEILVNSGAMFNINNGGNIGSGTALLLDPNGAVNVNTGGLLSLASGTFGNNLVSNAGGTITLLPGASLADGYSAGGVVNFDGGSIGGTFNANAGSQINFRSVTSVSSLVSNTGSEINVLSGGSWMGSSRFDVLGALNITAGGQINSRGDIGPGGVVTVSGASAEGVRSTWTNSSDLDIDGSSGPRGALNILNGGRVSVASASQFDNANVLVSGVDANGNPSTLSIDGRIRHGRAGDAMMRIESGGSVTVGGFATIGASVGNVPINGLITVDGSDASGNASALRVTGELSIANRSSSTATVNVTNGGLITSGTAEIGTAGSVALAPDNVGVVNVNGADSFGTASTWNINGDLQLGQDFLIGTPAVGTLNIGGGTVTVTGITDLQTGGGINLSSGRFDFGATTLADYNRFNATGGALAGAVSIAGTNGFADLANQIAVANVDTTGVTLLNNGLVFGAGTLDAGFANGASGEIEVITGERMRFNSGNTSNAGQVTLLGGQVQFAQAFTNQAGGLVLGNGSLRADGGTSNAGTMAFSATTNVVGDLVNEATGLISSSGGTTTFFDDVTNNGEIRTNANSFTVFGGAVSGSGSYTESGTVIFAGSFSPGSSPANVAFGGDVGFVDDAELLIELAGEASGEFDSLTVDGQLTLDGELSVSLLDGYTPALGDSFDVLNAAGISGVFDSVTLPAASFELIYSPIAVRVIATSALPGDYNNDGSVDAADYSVWRDNLGSPAGTLLNDTVGGVVGSAQYEAWRTNYGATLPASPAAVPEPGGVLLVCGGLAFLLWRGGSMRGEPLACGVGLAILGISPLAHADLVTGPRSLRDSQDRGYMPVIDVRTATATLSSMTSEAEQNTSFGATHTAHTQTTAANESVISFGGNLRFSPSNALNVDLGGTAIGDYDRLVVAGNVRLDGFLSLTIDPAFSPAFGDSFEIIDVGGSLLGQFIGLDQGAIVGTFDGVPLTIDYTGGDGNDVVIAAVPEMNVVALLGTALAIAHQTRRRR